MNNIHPSAVISADVVIGSGNTIGPFVVIDGPVVIGDSNWIGAGVVIGAPPEVRSYPHPKAVDDGVGNGVRIGDRNTIREYAQIHHGWKGVTTLGDDTFIMNQSYIAHDCVLGDRVTLASSVLLAGHVRVGADANLGLGVKVHQFCEVGRGSMIGMGAVVVTAIPPFAKAYGVPAVVHGVNAIGMERTGVEAPVIRALNTLYSEARESGSAVDRSVLRAIEDDELRDAVLRWSQRGE